MLRTPFDNKKSMMKRAAKDAHQRMCEYVSLDNDTEQDYNRLTAMLTWCVQVTDGCPTDYEIDLVESILSIVQKSRIMYPKDQPCEN